MSFIKRHKYNLLGILTLILLFVVSIFIRLDNLKAPLSRHHEWLTGHTLITLDIWEEEGLIDHHFSPVYTYAGEGNRTRPMLGGIEDERGRMYYVSYPPFAFLMAYGYTQILGGQSVQNIRSLNLIIHLLCTIFIYFLVRGLSNDPPIDKFHLGAVFAGFLYLFSTGNLWMHGNLYFVDMLVQLWIILSLWMTIRILRDQYKSEKWILLGLGLFFFLGTYTEWIMLFLSFFTGISFLIYYFINKRRIYLRSFLIIGISSSLALGTTVAQYSSIMGWDTFKAVSEIKYNERSGHNSAAESPAELNLESDLAYEWIQNHIDNGYLIAENFVGIFFLLLIVALAVPYTRKRMGKIKWAVLMIVPLFLAILLHYLLFFNFNALHDFSALKVGLFMILIIGIFLTLVSESIPWKWNLILGAALIPLAYFKAGQSYEKYMEVNSLESIDWDRIESCEIMREYSDPDVGIYTDVMIDPKQVYLARHNTFPVLDTIHLLNFFEFYQEERAQYYFHDGSKLIKMVTLERQGDRIVPIDSIFFNQPY